MLGALIKHQGGTHGHAHTHVDQQPSIDQGIIDQHVDQSVEHKVPDTTAHHNTHTHKSVTVTAIMPCVRKQGEADRPLMRSGSNGVRYASPVLKILHACT